MVWGFGCACPDVRRGEDLASAGHPDKSKVVFYGTIEIMRKGFVPIIVVILVAFMATLAVGLWYSATKTVVPSINSITQQAQQPPIQSTPPSTTTRSVFTPPSSRTTSTKVTVVTLATSSQDLYTLLQNLRNFPEEDCPFVEGRTHTTKYVYVTTKITGGIKTPILRYPNNTQDLGIEMSPNVVEKISAIPDGTPITAYYYEVAQFPANSGGDSDANHMIWCFNLRTASSSG